MAYSPTAGMLHILKEYHTERMGIVDFCNYVIADRNDKWPNAEWVEWGDPAGEARFSKSGGGLTSNAELMLQSGIRLKSSEQNWAARRESVEYQLGRLVAGEPALLIDPSCHRLINGFLGGYCYPEVGTTGIYRDTPEKNKFSHCLVGNTSIKTQNGDIRLDAIKPGDVVETKNGYNKVLATMSSQSDVYELIFSDGTMIQCTGDHPIITNKSIVCADSLCYGDVVLKHNRKDRI